MAKKKRKTGVSALTRLAEETVLPSVRRISKAGTRLPTELPTLTAGAGAFAGVGTEAGVGLGATLAVAVAWAVGATEGEGVSVAETTVAVGGVAALLDHRLWPSREMPGKGR